MQPSMQQLRNKRVAPSGYPQVSNATDVQPEHPDHAVRRQMVLRMLAEDAALKRAAVFDLRADSEAVICTIAIRGMDAGELRIPRDKYDPWAILDALRRGEQ